MKRVYVLLAGLLASATTGSAAIDFTPTIGERVLDGIKFPQLIFHEDGRQISYEPPRGWIPTESGSSIKFVLPNLSQAYAQIEQAPLPAPQVWDEPTTKVLQQQALVSVPLGSLNALVLADAQNPVLVNGNPTYEVTIGYTFLGQEFRLCILYIHTPGTQLRMRAVARKEEFEKVQSAFRGSALSFKGLRRAN